MLCSVRICKHEGKQKYLYKMRRRAGSAPAPSPAPLPEPWGEGGGLAGCVLPGDLEQGRGDLWLVSQAGLIRMWIWQVHMASLYGKIFWRVCLAGQYGGSNGLIYSKDLRARKHC